VLSYAEVPTAEVLLETGAPRKISIDELANYVTEAGNPKNERKVTEVHVGYPAPFLRQGLRIVDTPGVGSIYAHNTDTTYAFLPKADAVLFVLSVDQPLTAAERDFLTFIRESIGKTFFLLNKIDLLDENDLKTALAFTQKALTDAIGTGIVVYPISSRRALSSDSEEAEERSGFPKLLHVLAEFLKRERGAVLERSIARQVLRVVAQAKFSVDLELKSLTTPIAELEAKIRRLERKKDEILRDGNESLLVLGGEAIRRWMRGLDEDLAHLCDEVRSRISQSVDRIVSEHATASTRQLATILQERLTSEIRSAFDVWRAETDKRWEREVSQWCARHAQQVNDSVDELLQFASELFDIDYEPISTESVWTVQSTFYYKFWSEPPSLLQLKTALMLRLPRSLGHRLLRDHFKAFVRDSVDVQAGRTRSDFLERLETSLRELRGELAHGVDVAAAEIGVAVDRALRLRRAYASASSAKATALQKSQRELALLEESIRSAYPANATSDRSP
jgi:hypothetical protein